MFGGLKLDRTVTEGELFGKGNPQRLDQIAGNTVFLIGEHLRRHLTKLAQVYLEDYKAERVVFLTETKAGAEELTSALGKYRDSGRVRSVVTHGNIEDGIDRARAERIGGVRSGGDQVRFSPAERAAPFGSGCPDLYRLRQDRTSGIVGAGNRSGVLEKHGEST